MTPEIIPAESIQADDEPQPVISTRFGIGIAIFVAAVILHHIFWSSGL